jgi:hypothetical protein
MRKLRTNDIAHGAKAIECGGRNLKGGMFSETPIEFFRSFRLKIM